MQTRIASAAADTLLLASGSERGAVTIENSDANRLYVRLGSEAAAVDNYSFSLALNENAVLPKDLADSEVRGIWAADGTGYAMLTY